MPCHASSVQTMAEAVANTSCMLMLIVSTLWNMFARLVVMDGNGQVQLHPSAGTLAPGP